MSVQTFSYVGQALRLGAGLAGIAPAWSVLPVGRPDRVLLFMIEYDLVGDLVVRFVVSHQAPPCIIRCFIGMEALHQLVILGPVRNTRWLRPIRVSRNPGKHRTLGWQSREKLGAHSRGEFGNRRILKQGAEWQLHSDLCA